MGQKTHPTGFRIGIIEPWVSQWFGGKKKKYAENIAEVEDYIYNLPIGILSEDLKTKEEIVEEKLEVVHSIIAPR